MRKAQCIQLFNSFPSFCKSYSQQNNAWTPTWDRKGEGDGNDNEIICRRQKKKHLLLQILLHIEALKNTKKEMRKRKAKQHLKLTFLFHIKSVTITWHHKNQKSPSRDEKQNVSGLQHIYIYIHKSRILKSTQKNPHLNTLSIYKKTHILSMKGCSRRANVHRTLSISKQKSLILIESLPQRPEMLLKIAQNIRTVCLWCALLIYLFYITNGFILKDSWNLFPLSSFCILAVLLMQYC